MAWQPWDAEALAAAAATDRPILLSIGYSACHWCHVMAHESFEDETTAAVMNRHFVNIKVDREERPDLDQIYQNAHQLLTGRPGGWPLTLFLTPAGVPFYGGTYFPRSPRHGLPAFADLCERIAEVWRTRRTEIEAQNAEILETLQHFGATPAPVSGLDAAAPDGLRQLLLDSLDRHHGGFGGAPKFPHPTDLAFLLRDPDDVQAVEAALLTLRRMAEGGIHDQLGGGFCRYSVDARWEIPHFEKMLYDNGPLLGLYARAWTMSGLSAFHDAATGIVDWLAREMTAPDGCFYAALDADSEGEEGRFYVWDRAEAAALLTPEESALAGRHWGLDGPPNFEGRWHHLRVAQPATPEEAPQLAAARAKLLAAREQRVRPARDDKILTGWNALMIEGLAQAGRLCGRDDWTRMAQRACDALRNRRWQDGRLLATDALPGYLDDHAFLLAALLELLQAEPRAADLEFARALADALLTHFFDTGQGGFFFTAHDHEQLIQRPKTPYDNATPSGCGVATRALLRLGRRVGEPRYLDAAEQTLRAYGRLLAERPGGLASLALALEDALTPTDVNAWVCNDVHCPVPGATPDAVAALLDSQRHSSAGKAS